jgi:hypothetical protein
VSAQPMPRGCRCLRGFVEGPEAVCGDDCDLPERRAWADGARDAIGRRDPLAHRAGAVALAYADGRRAGDGRDPWGASLGRVLVRT